MTDEATAGIELEDASGSSSGAESPIDSDAASGDAAAGKTPATFLKKLCSCPSGPAYLWNLLYLTDWIVLVVLAGCCYFPFREITPVKRFQPESWGSDPSVLFPHLPNGETFPDWSLAMPFPAIVIIAFPFLFVVRSLLDVHHAFVSMLLAFCSSTFLAEFGKILVGMYRPNFVAQCNPTSLNSSTYNCLNSDMSEGANRSFPSGHASLSVGMWGLLSLYLIGKFHIFSVEEPVNRTLLNQSLSRERDGADPEEPIYELVDDEYAKTCAVPSPSEHFVTGGVAVWKAIVCMIPFVFAYYIALSRVMDYVHRPEDIIMGTVLGLVSALFSYHVYYPSLFSKYSHMPKSRYARLVREKEKCSCRRVVKLILCG